MLEIRETIVQDGPLFKKGYEAVTTAGTTNKDSVRYHIDREVGDIFDLVADLSKMVWILNRKIEGTSLDTDKEDEVKIINRTEKINEILKTYYK